MNAPTGRPQAPWGGAGRPSTRVMTFNLRRDVPEDGPHAWPHRRDAVAGVVLRRAPELVGTQEATLPMLADLDARLPGYARVPLRDEAWPGEEPNALYYDPRRVRVLRHGEIALSREPLRLGTRAWGSWLPRTALWAVVEWRATGAARLVVNTHFDHVSWLARAWSAALVDRVAGPHAFLLGDFNARPAASVAYRILARRRADPLAGVASGTVHGWSDLLGPRIDWVLVPRDARVLRAEVVRDRPGGRYPSDHDPVQVEVAPPAETRLPDPLPPAAQLSTRRFPVRPVPASQPS